MSLARAGLRCNEPPMSGMLVALAVTTSATNFALGANFVTPVGSSCIPSERVPSTFGDSRFRLERVTNERHRGGDDRASPWGFHRTTGLAWNYARRKVRRPVKTGLALSWIAFARPVWVYATRAAPESAEDQRCQGGAP